MAFSETEKVLIREYLGRSAYYKWADSSLESVLTNISVQEPEGELYIRNDILPAIAQLETAITTYLIGAGGAAGLNQFKELDQREVVMNVGGGNGVRSHLDDLKERQAEWINRLAIRLGYRPIQDYTSSSLTPGWGIVGLG